MGDTNGAERHCHIGARIEADRFLKMLDGKIELACINPQDAARSPSTRIAWVEGEGTVDKGNRRSNILAEIAQSEARAAERGRIVGSRFNGPAGQSNCLGLVPRRIISRAGSVHLHTDYCCYA